MDLSSFRLPAAKRFPLGSQGYLRNSISPSAQVPALSGLRINALGEDTGVEVTLSRAAKTKGANAEEISAEVANFQGTQRPSGVRSLLEGLSRVVSRIDSLKEELADAPLVSRATEYLERELESLQGQYVAIVHGDEFKKLGDLANAISNSIAAGANFQSLADSLGGESGFLGAELIGRIRSGDLANIQRFTTNLSTILDPSNSDLLSGEGRIGGVKSAILEALKSLEGGAEQTPVVESTVTGTERILPPPPLPVEVAFRGGDEVSIALRSFQGGDAIQAAMAHVELDPRTVLTLTTNDDPTSEEKKRIQKKEDEKRDTRMNRSVAIQEDDSEKLGLDTY